MQATFLLTALFGKTDESFFNVLAKLASAEFDQYMFLDWDLVNCKMYLFD